MNPSAWSPPVPALEDYPATCGPHRLTRLERADWMQALADQRPEDMLTTPLTGTQDIHLVPGSFKHPYGG